MIINLILTIIVLILLAFFAGFNLENTCNVNLLVHTFNNVPVFFTILISFAAGIVFTIPFSLVHSAKKARKQKKQNEQKSDSNKKQKKLFGAKKTASEIAAKPEETEKSENTTAVQVQVEPEKTLTTEQNSKTKEKASEQTESIEDSDSEVHTGSPV